jgi:hypothetical protein
MSGEKNGFVLVLALGLVVVVHIYALVFKSMLDWRKVFKRPISHCTCGGLTSTGVDAVSEVISTGHSFWVGRTALSTRDFDLWERPERLVKLLRLDFRYAAASQ